MAGKSATFATATQSPASSTSVVETTSKDCKKKPPKFSKMDEIVTILVKHTVISKKFRVHTGFAVHYSPVFKDAFRISFGEGQTQTFELKDTTEGAVQLLVQWIYSQKLDQNELEEEGDFCQQSLCLANLWVLADKLLIRDLQNAAIGELQALCCRHNRVPISSITYVYENTQEGSPLRRFLIYKCALKLKTSEYTHFPALFPKEMLLELAVDLIEAMDGQPKSKIPPFNISDYEVPIS